MSKMKLVKSKVTKDISTEWLINKNYCRLLTLIEFILIYSQSIISF